MKDKTKVARLNSKIEKLKEQIGAIYENCGHEHKHKTVRDKFTPWECPDCGLVWVENENECDHPNVIKKPDGDGGSYYDAASYWYDCFCPDCGKRWTIPQ